MELTLEQENSRSLKDYVAVFERRRKPVLVTVLLSVIVTVLAAIFWPPVYRSTAVILIEEQEVPKELVRSTVTSYAVQRIEEIKQRTMTIGNIMSIVERFGLYTDRELKRLTRTEISQSFRSNVAIEPISADVIDPASGRPTQAVIAFKMSFDGPKVETVQKVTNELVTLFLNENLKERTEQSASTSEFLASEATALNTELKKLEQDISLFKENHKESLPERTSFNLSIVDRNQQELLNITTRKQELERRKIELESELLQLNPTSPQILSSGEAVLSQADRLKALRTEYRRKQALYKPSHPDIIRLEREIEALQSQLGIGVDMALLSRELQSAKEQLSHYQDKYTANHPEIIKQQELVKKLEGDLASADSSGKDVIADNPAYVLISTQIQSINNELISLDTKAETLRIKINDYTNYLSQAPFVEKEYRALMRAYENTRDKFREVEAKRTQAELANNLEKERKGERFTLIQPPEIPESPVSPNRALLLFLGLIISGLLGVGVAAFLEMLDTKLHGKKAITAAIQMEPLVVIPYLQVETGESSSTRKLGYIAAGCTAGLLVVLVTFHFSVKPLDVTWYILLRKLGLN